MWLFGIIKQMQHLCGVASMIVSPSGALSPEGKARGCQSSLGGYNHAGNPTEMLHLFNVHNVGNLKFFDVHNVGNLNILQCTQVFDADLCRDLARTGPAYLLDRHFSENLLFGQAKISMKNFDS